MCTADPIVERRRAFPLHGWLGLLLVALFWPLNWLLEGPRTIWGFFPLWLGYSLVVDGINLWRRGTSLIARGGSAFAGLFVISIPSWWLFEAFNRRTRNWHYVGGEHLGDLEYALWASLSFSTVIPAVLGTAELWAGTRWVQRFRRGWIFAPSTGGLVTMAACGAALAGLTLAFPNFFYPCVWLSLVLIIEPLNRALGNRALTEWTARGDWRPAVSLAAGALTCGFFWEMWNFLSYPKWVYTVPFLGFAHVFEMPLAGYLGYLPFALELFALTYLVLGLVGQGRNDHVASGLAANRAPGSLDRGRPTG